MRKLGAISQAGIWLLPRTAALEAEFQAAFDEINMLGGNALVFHGFDISKEQRSALEALYNNARREEYADVAGLCERYLGHVQRLTEAGDFRFAAQEEMDQDLEKRRRAFAQVVMRDAFEVEERQEVDILLRECEKAFEEFVRIAFLAQAGGKGSD